MVELKCQYIIFPSTEIKVKETYGFYNNFGAYKCISNFVWKSAFLIYCADSQNITSVFLGTDQGRKTNC